MNTHYEFSLTKPQIIEIFKKQSRKAAQMILIVSIVLLCLSVAFAVLHYMLEDSDNSFSLWLWFFLMDVVTWTMFAIVKRSAPKNAERYFKHNSADDVVSYCYDLTDRDFVVSQPALGNVIHFKYELLLKVNDFDYFVTVMLESNQFLPILKTDATAPLIDTLKSLCKTTN